MLLFGTVMHASNPKRASREWVADCCIQILLVRYAKHWENNYEITTKKISSKLPKSLEDTHSIVSSPHNNVCNCSCLFAPRMGNGLQHCIRRDCAVVLRGACLCSLGDGASCFRAGHAVEKMKRRLSTQSGRNLGACQPFPGNIKWTFTNWHRWTKRF